MREIVPLVCSHCGGPADPSLTKPCGYCGVPAPHDPEVRARLRRHAEHCRRVAAKLRTAALHQVAAALARRQRERDKKRTLIHYGVTGVLPIALLLSLPYGGPALREEFGQPIASYIMVACFGLAYVISLIAAGLAPPPRVKRRATGEISRCEEKLELAREARCGNCGARSGYVQVGLVQSLSCPYCGAVLPTQCDAFEVRVRQAVERALIEAHVEAALDVADAFDDDPSAPLMDLAGFRSLGGIYEQRDAPCWVHSQYEQPWRCVVSADTTLPGRLVLMTPDTESVLTPAVLREVKLPETRFTVRLGGRELLGFADQEIAAHGVYSTDAVDGLAARLDRGELVQLDGAGGTAFRLGSRGELDAFARDFAGPLLAVVRSLSPRAA